MEQLTIIKVGGAVVEDRDQLTILLDQFSHVEGRKILVHGGGRRATSVAAALGIESRLVQGRRITNEGMLDVATMVYGGLVNKTIVAHLQALGLTALGLTGADLGLITAVRRPVTTVETAEGPQTIDFGFVGDIEQVADNRLIALLEQGITPVIAPLSSDGRGQLLNTNADTIASAVAIALAPTYAVTLVFAFEKRGVLRDEHDDASLIPLITHSDYATLVDNGTLTGGMVPKVENALNAVAHGVREVKITSVHALSGGTTIR